MTAPTLKNMSSTALPDPDDNVMFVRSQSQLARDNPAATGQRLTRFQAEDAFGNDLVQRVLEDDVVSLVQSFHEPANTIRRKREQLGIDVALLAKTSHLDAETVQDAETPGKIVSIQALNELCQVLALDERVLGYRPSAGGDDKLGVRLRLLAEMNGARSFSAATVMTLVEAAWVISKQMTLSEFIGRPIHNMVAPSHRRSDNYSYPAYEKGYQLAELTRELLGLDPDAPIESVRTLIEDEMNIPLIQVALETRFAGATIANGLYRGIVVNERGRNSDVAIRRMTICHELAHLLWDPDERLNKILVDDYEGIEGGGRNTNDVVEMRANSFAVSFLAPRSAVRIIAKESTSTSEALAELCRRFGISVSAARYHMNNVTGIDTQSAWVDNVDYDGWLPAENQTVDYLPGLDNTVPISRKGMFAGIVARAFLERRISVDTASMCLKTSAQNFPEVAAGIAEMWKSTKAVEAH